jgi:hypothetical protein
MGMMLLMTGAFAYSVDVTPVTLSPSHMNALTSTLYFKFNIDINTYTFSGGPDFNAQSLSWYSLTDANTMIAATYGGPGTVPFTWRFGKKNFHGAQNGDYNFKMIVTNGQGDVNYETGWTHAWSDENAPTSTHGVVQYNNGNVTIPVYCSDGMTAQEPGQNALPSTLQGSGCAGLWYNIDGGPWTWQAGYQVESVGWEAPNNIVITNTGSHTVQWCVEDNLDTNSCGSELWEKTVVVQGYESTTCNLVNLILFVLAAVLLITIVIGSFNMATEGFNTTVMGAIIVSAISVVIIIFVASTVSGIMCVV